MILNVDQLISCEKLFMVSTTSSRALKFGHICKHLWQKVLSYWSPLPLYLGKKCIKHQYFAKKCPSEAQFCTRPCEARLDEACCLATGECMKRWDKTRNCVNTQNYETYFFHSYDVSKSYIKRFGAKYLPNSEYSQVWPDLAKFRHSSTT